MREYVRSVLCVRKSCRISKNCVAKRAQRANYGSSDIDIELGTDHEWALDGPFYKIISSTLTVRARVSAGRTLPAVVGGGGDATAASSAAVA